MTALTLDPMDDGYEVRLGGMVVGTVPASDGSITIPFSILSDLRVRRSIDVALAEVDKKRALADIWAMIDENWPTLDVQSFSLEWCSEYNDEGGYYWAIGYASLYGPDESYIDDDDAQEDFRDGLYEIDMDQSYLPDGTYSR